MAVRLRPIAHNKVIEIAQGMVYSAAEYYPATVQVVSKALSLSRLHVVTSL